MNIHNPRQKRKPTNNHYNKRTLAGKPGGRAGKHVSQLDPALFVKKARPVEEVTHLSSNRIADLPVDKRLIANLLKKGYEHLTEIQDKTLDAILKGSDVLGIAQTGTGKTGAFLVPLINQLLDTKPSWQVLIVVPTRELAVQVESDFRSMTKDLGLYASCFIGGTNIGSDLARLKRPSHFVIGTPGRLNDLGGQGAIRFSHFKALVLDEFDRLLDMGFSKDIDRIVNAMSNRKQTVLFSATEERSQLQKIHQLLRHPIEARVSSGQATADHVEQEIIHVREGENKMSMLLDMIRDETFRKVLVFAETKRGVNKLCMKLRSAGVRADQIHGNKAQNYRLRALNDFKAGKIQVLIATDVAARGLDITEVTHVINFQRPKDFGSYLHRIGRTGRAGQAGKALTFID